MAARVRWYLGGLVLALAALGVAEADEPTAGGVLRDSFESARTSWREEATDQAFRLQAHDRSDATAHDGRMSEHFAFEAGPGSALYYSYSVPKTPLARDLAATLYVRSNRPGVQIFGQVILPADRDPARGDDPTSIFVPGSIADTPDHWQRIELTDVLVDVERQARVIRASTGREVSLEGAYLARVVVNLYGGPGQSEVFLDELTVSPVPEGAVAEAPERPEGAGGGDPAARGEGRVQLLGPSLKRDGADWFPRIVRAPGADPALLWRAGFDVLDLDPQAEPELAAKAAEVGFLLMPRIDLRDGVDPEVVASTVAAMPQRDAVAFLDLGDSLGSVRDRKLRDADLERVRRLVFALREAGAGPRLTTGTVEGQFTQYAQFGSGLDLLGVSLPPLGGMIDFQDAYRYLHQRWNLIATSNPSGVLWAWIPAASSVPIRNAVWGLDVPPPWGWPQVQPEQMRLAAFAALSAGYRGLGVLGDADLTSEAGLPRLYEASLLIAEVAMVEALLAGNGDPLSLGQAFPPDPKPKLTYNSSGMAGGFSSAGRNGQQKKDLKEVEALGSMRVACIDSLDGRTKLLLVADYAGDAQYLPGKMAMQNMNILIPAPESAQAYEISLGGLRKLESHRDAGGRRIVLETFNVSALVVLTTDPNLYLQLEEQINRLRPRAVDIAIQQAELQVREVAALVPLLQAQGVQVERRSQSLLSDAGTILESAREARDRQDFPLAWSEARTVGQPLRMLMRDYWNVAVKEINKATETNHKRDGPTPIRDDRGKPKRPPLLLTPVACPPLLSRNTLPRYPLWRDAIQGAYGPFGPNLLDGGEFDDPRAMVRDGWASAGYPKDGVVGELKIVNSEGWGKPRSALRLRVVPEAQVDREEFLKPDGTHDDEAYKQALFAVIDALPPFVDHMVSAIRTPPIPVKARNFVRIRVLVKMPREQNKGVGGLIVRDSIGGEALQFRTTDAIPEWKEVVLYRQAPADGAFTVTLGLAGYGDAFFDSLRVDVVSDPSRLPRPPRATNPIARRPGVLEPPSPSIPRR